MGQDLENVEKKSPNWQRSVCKRRNSHDGDFLWGLGMAVGTSTFNFFNVFLLLIFVRLRIYRKHDLLLGNVSSTLYNLNYF